MIIYSLNRLNSTSTEDMYLLHVNIKRCAQGLVCLIGDISLFSVQTKVSLNPNTTLYLSVREIRKSDKMVGFGLILLDRIRSSLKRLCG